LYNEFNRIIDNFQKVKLEKEMEQHYFQYSIKHVDTGLVSFEEDGKVELYNEAARKLLKLEYVRNISAFDRVKAGLSSQMMALKPGKQITIKLVREHEILFLSLRAAEFKLQDKPIKLISLQNIKNELDEKEMDSWQKLIRVLTHEIINSVSPITLLSSTLVKMFEKDGVTRRVEELDENQIGDALSGLQAINKRSRGLSRFVESYKSLTRAPEPVIGEIEVKRLFESISVLMKRGSISNIPEIEIKVSPVDLMINADEKMIEQVLINLLKNAIEAGQNQKDFRIRLCASEDIGNTLVEVSDNGPGIAPEVLENIFVPFYTTKKDGSGIGLSLSRQIIRKLGGKMEVISKEGEGATFMITL